MTTPTAPPMHPEVVADQPQTVRWVLPPETVPFIGPVRSAPGALGDLLRRDVVGELTCESCSVLVRLADGAGWDAELARVRDAVADAIVSPAGWQPYDDEQRSSDAILRAAVQEVLAGSTGDYVRSHGGRVTIASVVDGRVEVTFDGTCGHCPATGITLHDRLETEVRRKFPALKSISATSDGARNGPRLFSIRRRRDC